MEAFFQAGTFPCPIYCRTRDKTDEYNTRGRQFMEFLWRDCGALGDPDARQRATQDMPAVFWELYLAHVLRASGVRLQAQARTVRNKKGPDLLATSPDVWIEAILPGPGTGPDRMEYPPMGIAYDVPVVPFILRLRNAFETKANAMREYIKAGLVQRGHATVIAISGAILPTALGEGPIPRILQAILGVGNLVLDVERRTGRTVDHSVEHRDAVEKQSGAEVGTYPFRDSANSHISAVIYSASCWVNHPGRPGVEFAVIHNEYADVRLPHGWLSVGDEYWREGDVLRSAAHSPSPA